MLESDGGDQTIRRTSNSVSALAATPIKRCRMLEAVWENGLDDTTRHQQVPNFRSVPLIATALEHLLNDDSSHRNGATFLE